MQHFGSNPADFDPAELLAVRENLESCRRLSEGPPSRVVPETLCAELEKILRLLEMNSRGGCSVYPHD